MSRLFYSIVLGALTAVIGVYAQTQIDVRQLKNVIVSPIASVERWQCVGSGTVTNPDGTSYKWDCNGMQAIRLVLSNGTVLGPYVNIPMGATLTADPKWQPLPLAAPDPALPK